MDTELYLEPNKNDSKSVGCFDAYQMRTNLAGTQAMNIFTNPTNRVHWLTLTPNIRSDLALKINERN